jgi:hypothetical protein
LEYFFHDDDDEQEENREETTSGDLETKDPTKSWDEQKFANERACEPGFG